MPDAPWPTADDVAARLRQPLSSFTPLEQEQLGEFLASAVDQARRVPDWRTADLIPPRVWSAVVSLAALDYWQANPSTSIDSPVEGGGNPASARYRYLNLIGLGRGARPVAR